MPGLNIACFGALHVDVDGQPVQHFDTDKSRALLVYLAVENGHAQARSHLAGLLWSDQSEEQAMHSLRQTISSLRKALGDNGSSTSPYLLSERDMVLLNPTKALWVDVHAFQSGLEAACRYYQRRDQGGWLNVRRLEAALAMRHGSFLANLRLKGGPLFDEWQMLVREDLDQRALQGLALLAEIYEKRGDLALARQTAQRILEIAPWDEQAHVAVMRLFALDGQISAAQNQYHALRRYLQEHLGVEPSAETKALFAEIRSPARRPAGQRMPAPLANLPAFTVPFVGRELELDAITDLLADPACRLLTVLGPGGIGKTRLALEAARQQVGLLPDGVYFVPLAGITTLDQVYLAIAEAMKLVLTEQSDPRARLLDYLRGKRMLMVLDNYEHLLSIEAGVRPVAELLGQAPGLTLLVTSRERLMLQEEWAYLLSGLRYPVQVGSDGINERMIEQFDALGLFTQRACQAQVGFSLDAETLLAAIRICQLLEGLPLGIELAAAAVWERPITEIADQIAKHINAFAAPAVNVQPRHRSLWAAFDVSWQLLSQAGQALFCRLGVFKDGFSLQAAQQVAGAQPDLLEALLSKSLVRCDAHGRYALHEAVRQYALEKLADAGCWQETRAAHARYYAGWLADQGSRLYNQQQKQAFFEIQEEMGNARLAWTWLVEHQAFALIDDCVDSLYQFFDLRSRFVEGVELFQPAAACLEGEIGSSHEAGLEPIFGKLLARIGSLAYYVRHNALALETLERAQAIFIRLDQPVELAFCRTTLGGVYLRAKNFERARACAQQNLDYYRGVEDALGQNRAFYLMGLIENKLGRFRESRRFFQAAVDAGRHLEDRRRLIAPLNLLGDIACNEGNFAEAESLFQQSLAIARDLQDLFYQAIVLNNLATVFHYNHQYQQARQVYEQSILICKEIGDRDGEAMALNNLGELAVAEGQYEQAVSYSQQALQIARQIGEEWTITVCLNNLGEASNGAGQYIEALAYLKQAVQLAWKIESVDQVARFMVNVGRSYQMLGRQKDAVEMYRAALAHSATEHEAREKATRWLEEIAASPAVGSDDAILEELLAKFIR